MTPYLACVYLALKPPEGRAAEQGVGMGSRCRAVRIDRYVSRAA